MKRNLKNIYNDLEEFGYIEGFTMTISQQIFIYVYQVLNIENVFYFYTVMWEFKTGTAFFLELVSVFIITIPVHACIMFLSLYARRKIIRLWDCMPIFKGLGFTILILKNNELIRNNYIASMLFHLNFFSYNYKNEGYSFIETGEIWRTCDFSPEINYCISLYGNDYLNCTTDKLYSTSLSIFMRKHVGTPALERKIWPIKNTRIILYSIGLIFWCVTGIFIFLGVKRLLKLFLVLLFIISILICTTLLVLRYQFVDKNDLPFERLLGLYSDNRSFYLENLHIWIFYCVLVSGVKDSATSSWIGSLSKKKARVGITIIVIYVLKALGTFVLLATVKTSLVLFYKKFKDVIRHCPMVFSPDTIIYEFVFEAIYDLNEKYSWSSLYINLLFTFIFINNVVCGIIIVDSILDAHYLLRKRRFLVTSIYILINCIQSLFMYTDVLLEYTFVYPGISYKMVTLVVFLIISFTINYFYFLDNVYADYIFTYHENPIGNLKNLIAGTSALALLMFSCGCFWMFFTLPELYSPNVVLVGYIIAFLILLPTIFGAVFQLIRCVEKPVGKVCRPHPSWGPWDAQDKIQRVCFLPKRDACYRFPGATCTHKCLLKNFAFYAEKKIQKEKFEAALKELSKRKGLESKL